jgi:hypothetical protein
MATTADTYRAYTCRRCNGSGRVYDATLVDKPGSPDGYSRCDCWDGVQLVLDRLTRFPRRWPCGERVPERDVIASEA